MDHVGANVGGIAPDEINHLGDIPYALIRIPILFLVLAWVAVLLRIYARAYLLRRFGKDDWTMMLAVSFFTLQCGVTIKIGAIELGKTLRETAPLGVLAQLPQIATIFQFTVIAIDAYLLATIFLKISLALFFLRISTSKWHSGIILGTTVIYVIFNIALAFVATFQCGNPKYFLAAQLEGTCISNSVLLNLNYFASTLNAITDWIYVVFPLYTVATSPMMKKVQKISVCILLVFAALGSVCSLVRIAYIHTYLPGPKWFHSVVKICSWSIAEPGIGIFTASLATLRPMFQNLRSASKTVGRKLSKTRGSELESSDVEKGSDITKPKFPFMGVLGHKDQDLFTDSIVEGPQDITLSFLTPLPLTSKDHTLTETSPPRQTHEQDIDAISRLPVDSSTNRSSNEINDC